MIYLFSSFHVNRTVFWGILSNNFLCHDSHNPNFHTAHFYSFSYAPNFFIFFLFNEALFSFVIGLIFFITDQTQCDQIFNYHLNNTIPNTCIENYPGMLSIVSRNAIVFLILFYKITAKLSVPLLLQWKR